MKIGLSYDQGTSKYRLYVGALLAAACAAELDLETVWLAGSNARLDASTLESIDGLLLTGGSDVEPHRYRFADGEHVCLVSPGRDDVELAIVERAFARRIPILAICRGMQLVNVYRGGTLVPHLAAAETHALHDDSRHHVTIAAGSSLSYLAARLEGQVTSSHHQAVGTLGDGLQSVAHHADGTVEAIEWTDPTRKPWLAAVQWHPERMNPDEPLAKSLFLGFLQATNVACLAECR
ncbi:MAG: gamma-glutamyl-gamma-aminobutyrate hydrolase family protein [Candidatus Baltobacteraceae bacterium]